MNYQIKHVMEEYDPDMDSLLFYLPLSGSAFKKIYYDEIKQRAVAKFVPAEDLVIPYLATDLESAERVTHVIKKEKKAIILEDDLIAVSYTHLTLPTNREV